jgi:type II secretion system protein H
MKELRSHGMTLVELLLVLAILGVAAAVAIPGLRSSDPQTLDVAAGEVASAMRYARSEAMRTGAPRGYRGNGDTRRIRVFRPDTSTTPWVVNYDIHHPYSKQLYSISLASHPLAAVDSMTHKRIYRGACNTPRNVYFDANGIPRCADPENVLLEQYEVTLKRGPHTRTVTLHGITGRVTVQ